MDGPVYKLEHVVHSREGMEDFEGPLDLILFLLSKNKIEIQDIPIALILEQYLAYLEQRQQMDLEVASEFITMAAQLMFIKSRMLLSLEDEEAQSEMEELIRSLEERRSSENYTKIKYVTGLLGPMGEFGRDILLKNPEPMESGKIFEYSHQSGDLLAALGASASSSGEAAAAARWWPPSWRCWSCAGPGSSAWPAARASAPSSPRGRARTPCSYKYNHFLRKGQHCFGYTGYKGTGGRGGGHSLRRGGARSY